MVSHHVFSQLVLFALLWLFILHLTWPKRPMAAPATPTEEPEPLKSKRHHSNEPKPFEGLTHKPHCALCARETTHPQAPPPVPPDPMPPTNRRPRGVDTPRHFCPLHIVQGLFSGDPRHHLSRQTRRSRTHRARLGLSG